MHEGEELNDCIATRDPSLLTWLNWDYATDKYIYGFMWDLITHPCININGSLAKHLLRVRYWFKWVPYTKIYHITTAAVTQKYGFSTLLLRYNIDVV